MAGDTFFPFLPGSGTTEKYYEALQAAAVGRYYKKPPAVIVKAPANNNHQSIANVTKGLSPVPAMLDHPVTPLAQPPPVPPRSSPRPPAPMSPPVPAVLKKIRMASGELINSEKHEWENYELPSGSKDIKIGKDFENLQIKEQRPCTEQDKQDLLFRLSLLKQVRVFFFLLNLVVRF